MAGPIRHVGDDVFVHDGAIVEEGAAIGAATRVWAFAHVQAGAVIGSDCNICGHTFIESGARIGDRVTVKNGVHVWEGITLEDDVFVGPNATFTNDLLPRSRKRPDKLLETTVRKGASVGANATIVGGVVIGEGAIVGAGAVVTLDVDRWTVVAGVPARFLRALDET